MSNRSSTNLAGARSVSGEVMHSDAAFEHYTLSCPEIANAEVQPSNAAIICDLEESPRLLDTSVEIPRTPTRT
jgi:hypothetical protein